MKNIALVCLLFVTGQSQGSNGSTFMETFKQQLNARLNYLSNQLSDLINYASYAISRTKNIEEAGTAIYMPPQEQAVQKPDVYAQPQALPQPSAPMFYLIDQPIATGEYRDNVDPNVKYVVSAAEARPDLVMNRQAMQYSTLPSRIYPVSSAPMVMQPRVGSAEQFLIATNEALPPMTSEIARNSSQGSLGSLSSWSSEPTVQDPQDYGPSYDLRDPTWTTPRGRSQSPVRSSQVGSSRSRARTQSPVGSRVSQAVGNPQETSPALNRSRQITNGELILDDY